MKAEQQVPKETKVQLKFREKGGASHDCSGTLPGPNAMALYMFYINDCNPKLLRLPVKGECDPAKRQWCIGLTAILAADSKRGIQEAILPRGVICHPAIHDDKKSQFHFNYCPSCGVRIRQED